MTCDSTATFATDTETVMNQQLTRIFHCHHTATGLPTARFVKPR